MVIASDPGQLYAVAQRSFAFRRYGAIYGWVIDSFWDDRIPAIAKSSVYDRIFVADADDVQPWTAAGVKTPGVLPWGADVWSSFSERLATLPSKTTDLLRVGRQPAAYEDDEATARLAKELGLSFEGRPPFGANDRESAQHLQDSLNRAKFLLAFSTSVSPAPYTHEGVHHRPLDRCSGLRRHRGGSGSEHEHRTRDSLGRRDRRYRSRGCLRGPRAGCRGRLALDPRTG